MKPPRCAAGADRESRHHAADEPPRLRRDRRSPAQRPRRSGCSTNCASLYRGVPASLANSSGIFLGNSAHCDLVRPGAALYGVNPTPGRPNPMRSVVELSGRILQMRNIERGETVGYGATWTAKRRHGSPSSPSAMPMGYPRAASGTDRARGGAAIVAGQLCPIAGRISMDLICIDVTDVPDGAGSSRRHRDIHRRRHFDRRHRRRRRHHRLRDPHAPRPALPSGLSRA